MRLLFVTPAFPPFTGGGERYARSLALELARRGHAVTIVTSDARAEPDFWRAPRPAARASEHQDGRLVVIRCPITGWPGGRPALLAWRKLMVMLSALPGDQSRLLTRMARRVPPIYGLEAVLSAQERPDVVFGFNLSWEYPALAARRYARRRALPFMLVPFAHLGESKRTRMARNNTMDHQRRLAAASDRVLALTEAEVRGFAEWAIPVEHMSVVGGGLDPVPPMPDSAAVIVRFRLRPPFALFVGRATHDKGAIDSAQAILRLRREGLPISLALVGRIAPEFSRFFNALKPAEREIIRPLGVLSEVDKHCLLEQAQMLLLPSRTDSFGLVLLEAWIHETPVIGAQAGGVASVISDGEDGLLTRFGDVPALAAAIRRLATDSALNKQLGEQGKRKVLAHYTWAQVADKVLAQVTPLLEV